jgi:hypothetical protein
VPVPVGATAATGEGNDNNTEDASKLLQVELQRALAAALPSLASPLESNLIAVRAIPGKTFAFLEFQDNQSAAAALLLFPPGGVALEFSLGEGYGETLPVVAKWGKPKQEHVPRQR